MECLRAERLRWRRLQGRWRLHRVGGTLIRHLPLPADQVPLLSSRVVGPSARAPLVPSPRPVAGLPTRLLGASVEAIDVPAVAGATQLDEGSAARAAKQAMVGRSTFALDDRPASGDALDELLWSVGPADSDGSERQLRAVAALGSPRLSEGTVPPLALRPAPSTSLFQPRGSPCSIHRMTAGPDPRLQTVRPRRHALDSGASAGRPPAPMHRHQRLLEHLHRRYVPGPPRTRSRSRNSSPPPDPGARQAANRATPQALCLTESDLHPFQTGPNVKSA